MIFTAHLKVKGNDEDGQMVRDSNDLLNVFEKSGREDKKVGETQTYGGETLTTGIDAAGDKMAGTSALDEQLAASVQGSIRNQFINNTEILSIRKDALTIMANKTGEGT